MSTPPVRHSGEFGTSPTSQWASCSTIPNTFTRMKWKLTRKRTAPSRRPSAQHRSPSKPTEVPNMTHIEGIDGEEKTKRKRRFPRPRVTVEVMQQHIDQAMEKDSNHCMIAEAIKETLPKATHVSVDLQTIR